jgi:cell pole-organizing protein PopZ
MSDTKTAREPGMDEILASIRSMISSQPLTAPPLPGNGLPPLPVAMAPLPPAPPLADIKLDAEADLPLLVEDEPGDDRDALDGPARRLSEALSEVTEAKVEPPELHHLQMQHDVGVPRAITTPTLTMPPARPLDQDVSAPSPFERFNAVTPALTLPAASPLPSGGWAERLRPFDFGALRPGGDDNAIPTQAISENRILAVEAAPPVVAVAAPVAERISGDAIARPEVIASPPVLAAEGVAAGAVLAVASLGLSDAPAAVPLTIDDDRVVELLRPMLQTWLDENMPRIVEKALRAGLDPGGSTG